MEDMAGMTEQQAPFVWRGRRVLVTGATGMVGSWLVKDLLAGGAYVVALIRDWNPQTELLRSGDVTKVSVVSGTVEDVKVLERAITEHETDTVFHLAAQTIVGTARRAPLATFEANIRGTYNLLEACRRQRDLVQRVVVASSDKAYGEAETLPYTEDTQLDARFPYDVSKSCADLIARSYYATYGLPVGIARCGNVYGGGDLNWSRIVPGTIRSFLNGERPIIRSDGTYLRDYIYVRDVAQAYMCLAAGLNDPKLHGQAFNFSTEAPLSVLEMVNAIQQLMDCGRLSPVILSCAEGEIRNQHLSAAKARAMLRWEPFSDLTHGLEETIGWYHGFLGL